MWLQPPWEYTHLVLLPCMSQMIFSCIWCKKNHTSYRNILKITRALLFLFCMNAVFFHVPQSLWIVFAFSSSYLCSRQLKSQHIVFGVLLHMSCLAGIVKQQPFLCIRAQRRVLWGRAQWHRRSCEFTIAPLDWPWLSGTTNAGAQGAATAQPPLPVFVQKYRLFHSQTFKETE